LLPFKSHDIDIDGSTAQLLAGRSGGTAPFHFTAGMDDSDDYGYDDFVLDEQTLAALDQAEQKYQNSLPKPFDHLEPVNKRHKTDTGWKAGLGAASNYLENDDFDDLPEISVRGDGSYSIRPTTTKETHINTVPPVGSSSSSKHQPPRYRDPKPPNPQFRPIIHSKAAAQSQVLTNKSNEHVASDFGQFNQLEKRLKLLQKDLEEVGTIPPIFESGSQIVVSCGKRIPRYNLL